MKIECNSCDWSGDSDDAVSLGEISPLCPECHETTTPSVSKSQGSYEAWRISYQSSEQAARAAFKECQRIDAERDRLEIDISRLRGIIKTERDAVIKLHRLLGDIETLAQSRRRPAQ